MLCLLLFSGCSEVAFTPENAIHAPGAVGIYRGVQAALEDAVGKDLILKYPLVGGINTAFAPCDFDGDGTQEMLAFYQLPAKGAVTRVNFIRFMDGAWHSVQDIDPVGSDVANVDFCDLNGDGIQELCLGWNIYTNRNNQMCVYQLIDGLFVQCAAEDYTKYVLCDIDQNGVTELGLALLDVKSNTSSIGFYRFNRDEWTVVGTLGLDRGVASYEKIATSRLNGKTVGVFLDAYKGADNTITELIYYKGGKLYNPFASSVDHTNVATLRYCKLTSSDVNNNGSIEIPFMESLPGYDADPLAQQEDGSSEHAAIAQNLICWREYNENVGDTLLLWWYNPSDGYYLEFDGGLQNAFTVVYQPAQKEYVFYGWEQAVMTDRLFGIRMFSEDQWGTAETSGYQQVYSDGTTIWAIHMEKGSALGLSFEQLKKSFHLILQ